jgi:hypothetical protein
MKNSMTTRTGEMATFMICRRVKIADAAFNRRVCWDADCTIYNTEEVPIP